MKKLNEFVFHSVHKFEYKTWYALKYNTYIHKANNKKNVGILFWKVSLLLLGFFSYYYSCTYLSKPEVRP